MVPRFLALAVLLAGSVLPARANTVDCGGNSFSYAEIRRAPPGQAGRGPIAVIPDSLCADLIETGRRPPPTLEIVIDPRSHAPRPADSRQEPNWK